MTYESTRLHRAWSEQVSRERKGAEWFYSTMGHVGRSQRWRELADIMHKPEYQADFMFHRTSSAMGTRKLPSRTELLSTFFRDLDAHKDKVKEVVDAPSWRRTLPDHMSTVTYFGLSRQSSGFTCTKTSSKRLKQPPGSQLRIKSRLLYTYSLLRVKPLVCFPSVLSPLMFIRFLLCACGRSSGSIVLDFQCIN